MKSGSPSTFIAYRYFRSKKRKNFISILSNISMIGVAVGTMALVIVLSVFNGLEQLVRGLYASFDADLKVELVRGKSFVPDPQILETLRKHADIQLLTEVIEDNALFKYGEAQHLARLKGVSGDYLLHERFASGYTWGTLDLGTEEKPLAVVGRGVGYFLSLDLQNEFEPLQVFYPRATARAGSIDPRQLYNSAALRVSSFFSVEKEFDDSYILAPLSFVEELFRYEGRRTALEIQVRPGTSIGKLKREVQQLFGEEFSVKDTDEQHASILRTIKIEKLFVFITLTFILAIASFNIFFSLSMMAIEKKKDTALLVALGAPKSLLRRIFLKQGALIASTGATIGLLLGFLICFLQERFGLVGFGVESSIVDYYPVKMIWTDFLWTGIAVSAITALASYRPAYIASQVDAKGL